MMKFFLFLLFMNFMMLGNLMVMFYYNLLFILGILFLMCIHKSGYDIFMMISMYVMLDFYSFMLILLSMWVIGLMYLTLSYNGDLVKLVVFMIMVIVLMLFFSLKNLMLFYFFFELSLVPTFMTIIYWGYNLERLSSAYYMLMYTLMFSLPLLIYLMEIYKGGLSYSFMLIKMMNFNLSVWGYLIILMAFLVKLPMYFFHIWLPKAHVEAPVYGSMVLAAILLKLGGYGMIQMSMIFLVSGIKYSSIVLSISIVGGIVSGLICLVQVDMKSLVAYSSVVHMNLMLSGLMSFYSMGFLSSYIIMISHGLCSSGLFYIVNIYYSRTFSRLMFINKGMVNMLPMFMFWWFLLCSSNFSFPLSVGFFGEIYMFGVILSWDINLMIYLVLISFISSIYTLYMFLFIFHGELNYFGKFNSGSLKEVMVLVLHYFPLVLLLLKLDIFSI